ncbi:MAG TPA: CZB domain-containing protein [Polyangiaceae bacterium]|jgi:hypothetical protein
MELHDAIEEHMDLHKRVEDRVGSGEGSLDADEIQKPDQCELGKWLVGDGAKHQTRPQHTKLAEAHAAFHGACADVLRQADAGTLEDGALGDKGPLYAALAELCVSISSLSVRIQ